MLSDSPFHQYSDSEESISSACGIQVQKKWILEIQSNLIVMYNSGPADFFLLKKDDLHSKIIICDWKTLQPRDHYNQLSLQIVHSST